MKKREQKPLVTVLIPAYNEEKTIEKIVQDSRKLREYQTDVLVVVDGKTTDNTENVAKKSGAKVVFNKKYKGKGAIIREAIPYIKGDFVVQIDADYQFLPSDISKLVSPLLGSVDVTLGTRYEKGAEIEKGSITLLKRLGSYFLSFLTSCVIERKVTDVMAGFKAFKTDVLKTIPPETNHFGYEAELVIKAAHKGYRIENIPVSYRKRMTGASNVHMLKHGLLVVLTIIKFGLFA